jgi:hypothetical protein
MHGLRGDEFKKKMEEDVYQARKNLKDFTFRKGRKQVVTVSTWGLVKRMDTIWMDQVHLVDGGYQKIGEGVVAAAVDLGTKGKRKATEPPPGPGSGSTVKKPRTEAVGQMGPPRGHHRGCGGVLRGRGGQGRGREAYDGH